MYSNPPMDYAYHTLSSHQWSIPPTYPSPTPTPSFPSFPWELFTPYYTHGSSSPKFYLNHGYSPHTPTSYPPPPNPYSSYSSSPYSYDYNIYYQQLQPTNTSSIISHQYQTYSRNRRDFDKNLHISHPSFKKRSKTTSQKPIRPTTPLSTYRNLPALSFNHKTKSWNLSRRSSKSINHMRRSFTGNPFSNPSSLMANHRSNFSHTPANSHIDFPRKSFDYERENVKDQVLKPRKIRSPSPAATSRLSKNFMSPTKLDDCPILSIEDEKEESVLELHRLTENLIFPNSHYHEFSSTFTPEMVIPFNIVSSLKKELNRNEMFLAPISKLLLGKMTANSFSVLLNIEAPFNDIEFHGKVDFAIPPKPPDSKVTTKELPLPVEIRLPLRMLDFPGGKVGFTSEMRFISDTSNIRVHCYRILDDDGEFTNHTNHVQVNKELAVRMHYEVVTFQDHQYQVTYIVFDDGDLVSSSSDCTLKRWRNDQCVESWEAHKSTIQAVKKLPTRKLVTGSSDTTLNIWKGKTCLHTFEGHSVTVPGLAGFSFDNSQIGRGMHELAAKVDDYVRGMMGLLGSTLFEELGLYYIGPVDGHNIEDLISVLQDVASLDLMGPVLFHVITDEMQVGEYNKKSSNTDKQQDEYVRYDLFYNAGQPQTYGDCFVDSLVAEVEKDKDIVGVRAGITSELRSIVAGTSKKNLVLVDVLYLSLGGFASNYFNDSVVIGSFNVVKYGATMGFFHVDHVTWQYLKLTGRSNETVSMIAAITKAEEFTFRETPAKLRHGDVIIAAITSCTNTSIPSVMLGAAFVAKKTCYLGLDVKPWIKTSLSPSSGIVTKYLQRSGLHNYLNQLGFNIVGYGCTTCIGNSGDIDEAVASALTENDIVVVVVLSGNRNFEVRFHQLTRDNYLASPPLVVAYALAGTVDINFDPEHIGITKDGKEFFFRGIWPSSEEIENVMQSSVLPHMFRETYNAISKGNPTWNDLSIPDLVGLTSYHRSAEDVAFSVVRFVQNGGTFVNYYMYHGGTNFDRTSGGPFIATSYDFDAPIDEFGLVNEPKWGHLKYLHKVIKQCEPVLLSADSTVYWPGKNLEVHVFKPKAGDCVAFLGNYDTKSSATIKFGNGEYELPPWSITILPDCKTAAFNTAKVGIQSPMKMIATNSAFSWLSYNEEPSYSTVKDSFTAYALWEQVNVTRDSTDYLWYMTDVNIDQNEGFIKNGQSPLLTINSAGHALHVFINGQLSGTVYGSLEFPKLTFSKNVKLNVGNNKISLLSITVGLPNVGVHFESWNAGVLGPVTLKGLNEGARDLSRQKWSYKIGLKGEALQLQTVTGSNSVKWVQGSLLSKRIPLTWYKTTFRTPAGNDPLALDMSTMGKGQVWINGRNIGRHWPGYITRGKCGDCYYAGTYTETKCRTNCGQPSQKWYHVPRSWLNSSVNYLVVFEELGGDPTGISLVKRTP